jgi:hypothetical protein
MRSDKPKARICYAHLGPGWLTMRETFAFILEPSCFELIPIVRE